MKNNLSNASYEEYMKDNSYRDAVLMVAKELKGSFALMILNKSCDEIIAIRKGSPLVLGVKENEFFLASDLFALLRHTNNVIFLEDNEAVILGSDIEIINFNTGTKIDKKQSF